mgnify:CR=1 FL=1
MNKLTTLKLIRLLLISLLFFSLTFDVQAQGSGIRITGTVVDSKGQQISGVSVKVKGTTTGATTDGGTTGGRSKFRWLDFTAAITVAAAIDWQR